jgi:hypothetical protein
VEINAGLNEYWNGNTEKLLNDDNSGDDIKSKFMGDTSVTDSGEGKKRRPALSHARSLDSVSSRRVQTTAVQMPNDSWWSFSGMAWVLVWIGFMLPIVEVGWGEARRLIRLRRLRMLMTWSSVHDL